MLCLTNRNPHSQRLKLSPSRASSFLLDLDVASFLEEFIYFLLVLEIDIFLTDFLKLIDFVPVIFYLECDSSNYILKLKEFLGF